MIFWYQRHGGTWLPRKAADKPMQDPKHMRPFRSKFHEIEPDEEELTLDILSRIYPAPD